MVATVTALTLDARKAKQEVRAKVSANLLEKVNENVVENHR